MKESIYDRMTKAEQEVACILQRLGILWSYEQPVFVWDADGRPRVWAPDFYLVDFGIYVEVCGSERFDYEYRRRIYNTNGCRVIFVHTYKDTNKWRRHLLRYLIFFTTARNQRMIKNN